MRAAQLSTLPPTPRSSLHRSARQHRRVDQNRPGPVDPDPGSTYAGGTIINGGTLQVNNNTGGRPRRYHQQRCDTADSGALVLDNLVDFEGNCGLEFNASAAITPPCAATGSAVERECLFPECERQPDLHHWRNGHMWDFTGNGLIWHQYRISPHQQRNSTVNFGSSNATFNIGTGNGALNQRNGGTTTHLGALMVAQTPSWLEEGTRRVRHHDLLYWCQEPFHRF